MVEETISETRTSARVQIVGPQDSAFFTTDIFPPSALYSEERSKSPLAEELGESLSKSAHEKEDLERVPEARTLDALLGYISQQSRVIHGYEELKRAVGVPKEDRLCSFELTHGVVTHCLDDEIVVRYDTPFGKLEQIYDKSQIIAKEKVVKGAKIEALCFAWVRPNVPKGFDRFFTPEELKRVEEAAAKRGPGPTEI